MATEQSELVNVDPSYEAYNLKIIEKEIASDDEILIGWGIQAERDYSARLTKLKI